MISQDVEWPHVSGQQLMPTESEPGQKKEEGTSVTQERVAAPGSQTAVVKGLFVFPRHSAGAILSLQLTLAPNSLSRTNLTHSSRLVFPLTSPEGLNPRSGPAHLFHHTPNPELRLLLALRGLEL